MSTIEVPVPTMYRVFTREDNARFKTELAELLTMELFLKEQFTMAVKNELAPLHKESESAECAQYGKKRFENSLQYVNIRRISKKGEERFHTAITMSTGRASINPGLKKAIQRYLQGWGFTKEFVEHESKMFRSFPLEMCPRGRMYEYIVQSNEEIKPQ